MLIGVFKSNQKVVSVLVIILSIFLWIPSFWLDTNEVLKINNLPFYLNQGVISFTISSLLIGIQGVYLNYIVNEFKLLVNRTSLPGLFFVVFNAGISLILVFTPIIIVNTLIIVVVHSFFLVYNKDNAFGLSFNVGFVLSIASLIYFPSIVLFPLFWFVLLYLKSPNWRDFIISILGFLVPVIFYISYYFINSNLEMLIGLKYNYQIFSTDFTNDKSQIGFIFFYVVFVLGVMAVANTIKTISTQIVSVRKNILILAGLAFLLIITWCLTADAIAVYILITIPIAVFFAIFFNNIKRKWLAELLFTCLLGSIIIGYFS
ncbi:MAG: hypothetical protein JKY30_00435 [Flavobacteriales bacterium]|nr:hypothetical protein [Flavobacteriales bacterium]